MTSKKITHEEELQDGIKKGLTELYLVAKAAYGPGSGLALIENDYGDPLASKDGVSNVQKVRLEDPVQNMAARIVVQASKQNNLHVGDGTTAVVILAYHLYIAARKLRSGAYSRREVVSLLQAQAQRVLDHIDSLSIVCTPELLVSVAKIAAGDEAIGEMVADVVKEVDGGITIEDFEGSTWSEICDGFFFPKGFTNVNLTNDPSNLESRYGNAYILVTEKRLSTVSDIAPIIDKIIGRGVKDLLIVGEVLEEAQQVLLMARLKGLVTSTLVDAPYNARSLFLEDLALVTGATVIPSGMNPDKFDVSMLGAAEKIVVTGSTTSIVGREGAEEDIQARVAQLQEQLSKTKNGIDKEALQGRISRLAGKMAIIHVGGATEVEQKETKLRVQDAVCAVQAASRGGIVPGAGVALALYGDVYATPYKELLDNVGMESRVSDLNLDEPWFGYDLTKPDELVSLLDRGIVDPTLVVKESVINATSVVTQLVMASVGITNVKDKA